MAVSELSVTRSSIGSARRLPALAGAGFVLCVVVAFSWLSSDTPGSGDSAATINAYYDAHHTKEIAASLLIAAAVPLLVIFGMTLATSLWPSDAPRRPFWQAVLAGGSVIAATCWLVTAAIHLALVDAADQKGMAGGALQSLNVLDSNSFLLFLSGLGVLMLGAAGALFARKLYPVLAWIALVTGILLFFPYADFAGFILSGLWIIATSVLMYRRGDAFGSA